MSFIFEGQQILLSYASAHTKRTEFT